MQGRRGTRVKRVVEIGVLEGMPGFFALLLRPRVLQELVGEFLSLVDPHFLDFVVEDSLVGLLFPVGEKEREREIRLSSKIGKEY